MGFPVSHFGQQIIRLNIANCLIENIESVDGILLDLGCGAGVWSVYLQSQFPRMRITGLDKNEINSIIREQPNIQYIQEDFNTFNTSTRYDYIVSFNAIHYYNENDLAIFRKISTWLKPGGIFLFVGPTLNSVMSRKLFKEKMSYVGYSIESLRSKMDVCGLKEKTSYYFCWYPGVVLKAIWTRCNRWQKVLLYPFFMTIIYLESRLPHWDSGYYVFGVYEKT
jgi:trans-aconitate methyltransferase